jgi:hypothetical protein
LYVQHNSVRNRDSVVGTALGYSLSDPGFEFRQSNEIVPFSKKKFQTGSTINQWAYRLSLRANQMRCKVNQSPPPTAEIKNECSYTSAPPTCFYGLDAHNSTFYPSPYVIMAGLRKGVQLSVEILKAKNR